MKKPVLFGIILTACVVIVAFVFSLDYPGGMISYWTFDEGEGTIAYDSVDANNGALVNGPGWTSGQVGGALSFDGLDDYVEVPNSANLDITDAIALEAWINPQTVGAWKRVIVKGEDISPAQLDTWAYILGLSQRGGVYFALFAGNLQTYINGAATQIPTNTWTHIAGTWDGAMMRIYVNGIEQSEKLFFSGPINIVTYPLKFGIAPHSGVPYAFNGKIDEAAIYNRALSAEEINQHYEDGLIGLGYDVECVTPPADMVSWWPGDGNADDIVGGNSGTPIGSVSFVPGMVGDAFTFTGTGADYVRVPNNISLEPSNVTVDAWVKADGTPGSYRYIVAKGAQVCRAASYALYTGSGKGLHFYVFNPTNGGKLSPGVPKEMIWNGNWHHVAGTYDGSSVRLYVDGAEVGNGTSTTIPIGYGLSTDKDLLIGQYAGCSYPFRGEIDEVEIFNRALSLTDIQDIYLAGSAGKCKEVVIEVEIDIKPGSDPNSINLGNHGLLPVAILGTQDFDVTTIVPSTIAIGEVTLASRGSKKAPKLAYSYEKVNDGYTNMMIFFDVQQLVSTGVLTETTTELSITATLDDGTPIEGKDFVNIVHY